MIKWVFTIFLALEDKLADAKEEQKKKVIDKQYNTMTENYKPLREKAPKQPSTGTKLKTMFTNTTNIARNAFDNTVGYGIAKFQNYTTKRHFSKDPKSDSQIVYLMHGVMQNEGSQWRLARQLRKEGKRVYHLKGKHHLPREENANQTYEQIDNLHDSTKLEKVEERNDYFSGHSSGGDMGIYLAGDERILKRGIKTVQARAPAPSGLEVKTLGQKLIMPLLTDADNIKTYAGKKEAVEITSRKPVVPVHIVVGEEDNLVPPEAAVYAHATSTSLLKGKNSTHFGSSGGQKDMNAQQIEFMNKPEKQYKVEYKAAA